MTHLGHIPVSDLPLEGFADITVRVVLTRQTRGPLRVTVEDTSGETEVTAWPRKLTSDAMSLVGQGAILRMRLECYVTRRKNRDETVTVYRNRDLLRVRELRDGESLDTEAIGVSSEVLDLGVMHGCHCDCDTWTEHAAKWGGWEKLTWDRRQEGLDLERDEYTLRSICSDEEWDRQKSLGPSHVAAGGRNSKE